MKLFESMACKQDELDIKFPERHKQIHKGCCKHCPTKIDQQTGRIDPESEDIKTLPKELIVREYLFVCAWRPDKLCKGICDFMEIDESFINSVCATSNQTTKQR